MAERTVTDDPTMAAAELRRAHVAAGPPRIVGSSSDISICVTLKDEAIEAESKTVVVFATGLRIKVAVPTDD